VKWRCAECGIDGATANKRRERLGLGRLRGHAVVCTPGCARTRERHRLRERYGKGSAYRYPLPPGWRCAECACSASEANAKRHAAGMSTLTANTKTCTPACARARLARVVAERRGVVEANAIARAARKLTTLRADPVVRALAARVREARTAAGLSQAHLGAKAGVSRSAISLLEQGPLPPVSRGTRQDHEGAAVVTLRVDEREAAMAPLTDEGTVAAWEFERDVAPGVAARCALDGVETPDMQVLITATTGDTLTVEVREGALIDPASLLYIQRRGLYEVTRVERRGRSECLTLRAFPSG
jgi:transcriptional regulator with XRE-family HTH domain